MKGGKSLGHKLYLLPIVSLPIQRQEDLPLHCDLGVIFPSNDLLDCLVVTGIKLVDGEPIFEAGLLGEGLFEEVVGGEALGAFFLLDGLTLGLLSGRQWLHLCGDGRRIDRKVIWKLLGCLNLLLDNGLCLPYVAFVPLRRKITLSLMRLQWRQQKFLHFLHIKRYLPIAKLLSLKLDKPLRCLHISHNEIPLPIELPPLIVEKNQIEDAIDFCREVMEDLLSLAKIVQVGEVHPQGLIA